MSDAKPGKPIGALLAEARAAMHMTQTVFGRGIGASMRTIQRWEHGETVPTREDFRALAAQVFPARPDLAEIFAGHGAATLKELGLVAKSPRQDVLAPYLVEAVVAAAAEALDCSPQKVRPALWAAFDRAEKTGLSVEQVAEALRPPQPDDSAQDAG